VEKKRKKKRGRFIKVKWKPKGRTYGGYISTREERKKEREKEKQRQTTASASR
jgi:hypothetical protein